MALKSSKQSYTFNIIESGESSDAVPFSLNNNVFGSETYDLETATGSPFVFNEEGEAAEETELSDVVFDNTLKNNTVNTVIDSIYSSKQKAVYQLVMNASEYGYYLTKVNVGDTAYAPGASWSVEIYNNSAYTFPNAGKEKVALVLSKCEKYIFCLANFTLTAQAQAISIIDSYNIEGSIPVYQEEVFYNSNASNNEWGVDLLIPDTRVDEDGMLIEDAYLHSQIDTAGTITSHIQYHDGSSKTENLAFRMVQVICERRGGFDVFYATPYSGHDNDIFVLCINRYYAEDFWTEDVRQKYDGTSVAAASSLIKGGNYIFSKISKKTNRGLRVGCFAWSADVEFDSTAGKAGGGHNYQLGDIFEIDIDFSFRDSTIAADQKILSLVSGENDFTLKLNTAKNKLQLVNDTTVVMEASISFVYSTNKIQNLHIIKDQWGNTSVTLDGYALTVTTDDDFSYSKDAYKVYSEIAYYKIIVDRLDGTRDPYDFSNPMKPFDKLATTDVLGLYAQRVEDDTNYLQSTFSNHGKMHYDSVSDSLYFPTSDGFEYFNNVTQEELVDDLVEIDYATDSDHAFAGHMICLYGYGRELFIYSSYDGDEFISAVDSRTGALNTKDNIFWMKFKPDEAGIFQQDFSADDGGGFDVVMKLYGTAIAGVSEDPKEYCIIKTGVGHRDFQNTATGVLTQDVDTYRIALPDETGAFLYNASTGEFIEDSDGDYLEETATVNLQHSDDDFEAFFDTINILFEPKRVDGTMTDTNIKLFVKAAVSMAKIEVSYTSDGNYTFDTNKEYGDLGEDAETASFANDPVVYLGTKQIVIKEVITDQREAQSIKLRVYAKMAASDASRIDDFKVFSINILSEGMVTINGGSDA